MRTQRASRTRRCGHATGPGDAEGGMTGDPQFPQNRWPGAKSTLQLGQRRSSSTNVRFPCRRRSFAADREARADPRNSSPAMIVTYHPTPAPHEYVQPSAESAPKKVRTGTAKYSPFVALGNVSAT